MQLYRTFMACWRPVSWGSLITKASDCAFADICVHAGAGSRMLRGVICWLLSPKGAITESMATAEPMHKRSTSDACNDQFSGPILCRHLPSVCRCRPSIFLTSVLVRRGSDKYCPRMDGNLNCMLGTLDAALFVLDSQG